MQGGSFTYDNSLTSVSAEDNNTKKADEPDPAPELKNLS